MKRLLIVLLLFTNIIKSYSQAPPNLLRQSEDSIRTVVKSLKCTFVDKIYSTELKKPILRYATDYDLSKHKNSIGNTMLYGFFRFDIENSCTACVYGFAHSSDLEPIIKELDGNPDFKRKKGSMGWSNTKLNFDVDIITTKEADGFVLKYTSLQK